MLFGLVGSGEMIFQISANQKQEFTMRTCFYSRSMQKEDRMWRILYEIFWTCSSEKIFKVYAYQIRKQLWAKYKQKNNCHQMFFLQWCDFFLLLSIIKYSSVLKNTIHEKIPVYIVKSKQLRSQYKIIMSTLNSTHTLFF